MATCLMFVGEQYGRAEEAMNLYVDAFADSRIESVERSTDGDARSGVRFARFVLAGREYVAMDSDGPHHFTFTPAISLFVDFDDEAQLDETFAKLSDGATMLMPLQAYDFSPRFGWLQDRYGVSWQLNLVAS